MCTAATYQTKDFYFGRTLDYEFSYGEEIVVMPRRFPLNFRHIGEKAEHYAIIGMAHVAGGVPLFYDAINEKGLGMAGLNFVGNADYKSLVPGTAHRWRGQSPVGHSCKALYWVPLPFQAETVLGPRLQTNRTPPAVMQAPPGQFWWAASLLACTAERILPSSSNTRRLPSSSYTQVIVPSPVFTT